MTWWTTALLAALLPAPPVLTLKDAVDLALAENRLVAIAGLDVGRAGDRAAATAARRLPTLDVNVMESSLLTKVRVEFPAGAFGSYPATGPIPGRATVVESDRGLVTTGYATLRQPLSQLYEIGLGLSGQREQEAAARERLRGRRHEVAAAVRKAYYGVLRAGSAAAAAGEAVRLSAETLRVVLDRAEEKVALESDVLEAKARAAQAEYDLLVARDGVVSAKEQLNALLARDLATDFDVAAAPPLPEAEGPPAGVEATQPDIAAARHDAAAADFDLRYKRIDCLPDIGFAVNYVAPWGVQGLPKSIFTVGVSLSWEAFDGGRRAREVAEKAKAREAAALAVEETAQRTRLDAARAGRQVAQMRLAVKAAALARDAAEETRRVAGERYREKAILLSDLLRADAAVADARRRADEALLSYWSARADLDRTLGTEP